MTCQILAGPRLDSLRFALLDEAAIARGVYDFVEAIRDGFFALKREGATVPNAFHWAPSFHHPQNTDDNWIIESIGTWAKHLRDTRALDPFGVLNWGAEADTCDKMRLDLSRSGYFATFHSAPNGPGYLAIKDFGNRGSSVHPVQFDLAASWLWNYPDALTAAQAAAVWWARSGVLNQDAALALLGDYSTHRVTRADVCVDHTLSPSDAWERADLDRFAGRAKARGFAWLAPPRDLLAVDAEKRSERKTRRRELYAGPRSFTLYIGCRSATFLRIYDKTAELGAKVETSPAADVWRRNGWDGVDRVWRAEVQICSKSLQYLNTNWGEPMRQLHCLCPRQLWALYCESMRHVDLDASRLSRCSTSDKWATLRDAAGDAAPAHRSPIEAKEATQKGCLRLLDQALKRCLVEGCYAWEVHLVVDTNYDRPEIKLVPAAAARIAAKAEVLKSIRGESEASKSSS